MDTNLVFLFYFRKCNLFYEIDILVHNGKKTCSGKIPEPKKEVGRKKLTTKSGRTVTVNVKMPIKGLSTQTARFNAI